MRIPLATVPEMGWSEGAQFVIPFLYDAVARFGHLVPRSGEVEERLGDDDPRLVRDFLQARTVRVQLPHRAQVGAEVKRARLMFAGVPERPHTLPVGRPYRHLDRVLRAMTMPNVLHKADPLLDGRRRIIFQAESERQVEQHLRIGRSLHVRIQRLVHGEREIALYEVEVAYEAVVNPQPLAVTEGVAVGLLDSRARGGSDVGEEQRRVYVARDLAQVSVVPGRLDASEDGGALAIRVIPSDPEAVAVCGIDAQASMAALVDEGVLRLVEQLLDEDG